MTSKPWFLAAAVYATWVFCVSGVWCQSTRFEEGDPPGPGNETSLDGRVDPSIDRVDQSLDGRVDPSIDRIVAVVDGDPIFHSDLRRAAGLGLVDREVADRERKVLDLLIEQRLRSHESDRHQTRPITSAEIEAQLEGLASRFGGERQLLTEARAVGLDRSGLRRWIRHQLKVLRYVEERLVGRVFIDEQEIASYYEQQYCPNHPVPEQCPPLGEARDEIEALLRGMGLNREIEVWTEELRQKARIVDLLDRSVDALPPVVMREELPGQEKNQ